MSVFFWVLYTQNTYVYTKEPLPGIDLDCNEACDSVHQWKDVNSVLKCSRMIAISYVIPYLMASRRSSTHWLWFFWLFWRAWKDREGIVSENALRPFQKISSSHLGGRLSRLIINARGSHNYVLRYCDVLGVAKGELYVAESLRWLSGQRRCWHQLFWIFL